MFRMIHFRRTALKTPMMNSYVIGFVSLLTYVAAQSNYDTQANSVEYAGEGLPESGILDGKVTKLDEIAPIIFLNRTKAALNCAAGFMQIDLKFESEFRGIIYSDFERYSTCTVVGNGTRTARIELPLKGCGTIQNPTRVFTNNIVVRFHPSLEIDGDEVITIVCRYPPPVAPPPPLLPPGKLLHEETPRDVPLKGFQILLILCAIIFLSLVLLGLAASYYCLRHRRIQVIRRHPAIAGSEITKISESSSGALSMYEGLKIPRAHAIVTTAASVSESEMAIVSGADTIPSDYPSESPSTTQSEVEEMLDARSLHRSLSSSGSYENRRLVQDSFYSEQYGRLTETEIAHHRPPPPQPKFDVDVRLKKPPPPPPTPSASSSDTEGSTIMQERNLSTIHERDETVEMMERGKTFAYKADIHSPPKSSPIYSEVVRKDRTDLSKTEYREEMIQRSAYDESDYHRTELTQTVEEPPSVIARKPEITSHFVDDVFLKTITEKKTIEDIERHRRQVTEYHSKPSPPLTKWDVEIRNYPNPNAPSPMADESTTDWDTFSENSSIYGVPPAKTSLIDMQERHHRSTLEVPVPDPAPSNWDSLVKVLEYPSKSETTKDSFRSEYTLTTEDRKKWRKIITTESTLRTMLTEATVKEDYERIRRDHRYEKLFEPEKWDVIIRILTPQDRLFDQKGSGSSNRYRRKSEWDTRSRRSSLPTLYEYDSDGSSLKNIRQMEAVVPGTFDPLERSRRTSRSSMRSATDVRSMSEITVDFAKQDVPDNMSDGSSYYRRSGYYDEDDDDEGSLVRSLSQPSLARSASEFTESWGIRGRGWDMDSPDQSPRSSMRSTRDGIGGTSSYSAKRSSYHQERRWYEDSDRL